VRFGQLQPRHWLAAALIVAVAIQFVPVQRSNPPIETEVDAPKDVAALLRRACYDCHSNETRWPWYSRVAPASWLVARDVRRARKDLNFSEWPVFDFELQEEMLADVVKQVERGRMPLAGYVLLHPEASLRPAERQRLVAWARRE
jgi:hypothetical protein